MLTDITIAGFVYTFNYYGKCTQTMLLLKVHMFDPIRGDRLFQKILHQNCGMPTFAKKLVYV